MKDQQKELPLIISVIKPEDTALCMKQGMCIHGYSEGFCPWPREQCDFGTWRNFMVSKGKVWKRSQQPSGSYWWVHESEGGNG